jgi:hypothetical protein
MYLRPVSNAEAHVDPEPAKASSTVSPGSEKQRINRASIGTGF